jgi:hypothetical protein
MTGRPRLKVLDEWQSQISRLECALKSISVFFANDPFKCFEVRHGLKDVPRKSQALFWWLRRLEDLQI